MTTTAIHELKTDDNVVLHLAYFPPRREGDVVFLITHGVANAFYSSPAWNIGRKLAARGFGVAVLNNRGHDWVAINPHDQRWIGGAFERIEDGALDFHAAFSWLEKAGHRKIVLAGHSLGGLKAAYTQAHKPHPNVVALAMCSSPRLPDDKFWDWHKHLAILERCNKLISEGRGNELLAVEMPTNTPALRGLMSAATYLNKYGADAATTTLRFAERISVPVFLLAGTEEKPQLSFARDLKPALVNAPSVTFEEIAGADHFYTGKYPEVVGALSRWLSRFQ